MLDYCSSDGSGSSGYHPNPSPNTMSNILNMGMENGRMGQPAFVLSSPPLAALHNMTEMKAPSSSANLLTQAGYSQAAQKHFAWSNSTPHGICDILSRPSMAAFGLSRLNAAGMYLNSQGRLPKLAELPGRPPIYWPGVINGTNWRPSGGYRHKNTPKHHP